MKNKLFIKYNEFITEGVLKSTNLSFSHYQDDEDIDDEDLEQDIYTIGKDQKFDNLPQDYFYDHNGVYRHVENVHPDIRSIFEKIQEFVENDEYSKKNSEEYFKLFEERGKISKFKKGFDRNIPEDLKIPLSEIDSKIDEINTKFHIHLFKNFPEELQYKYSKDWISKNISKNTNLLI